MVEGSIWLDTSLQQCVNQAAIEVETGSVDLTPTLWNNPWPGNGEVIHLDAKILHQLDILWIAMVVIAGYQPTIIIQNLARGGTESIPDGLSTPILVGCALNLIGVCAGSPTESFRKLQHSFLSSHTCIVYDRR